MGHDITFPRREEVDRAIDTGTQTMEFNVPLGFAGGGYSCQWQMYPTSVIASSV
jgi:hypothetical protein